jgi:hypothetical protein
MKRIFLLFVPAILILGCQNEYVDTIPQNPNFQNNVPNNFQACDVCASTPVYQILPPKPQNINVPPTPSSVYSRITIISRPVCTCPRTPMVPANYFVTYEPLKDYPITYKTKYTEPCSCY